MALINKALNEVTVKLVYYGPGLCGKTTNLERIYGNSKIENKGKLISMSTETDRTLFFDFMPMELGTIAGQKLRVQLYTVPGQVFYDATRRLVLRGADGVVFVADSQRPMLESDLESLENLRTNLRINRLDPDKIPIVFQYNKRDLPEAATVEEISAVLKPGDIPVIEAVAVQGTGVVTTLRAAVGRILENLRRGIDITLPQVEGAPADEAASAPAQSDVIPEAPAPASVEKFASVFASDDSRSSGPVAAVPAEISEATSAVSHPLAASLESAERLVRSLEDALEAARAHERFLRAEIERSQ